MGEIATFRWGITIIRSICGAFVFILFETRKRVKNLKYGHCLRRWCDWKLSPSNDLHAAILLIKLVILIINIIRIIIVVILSNISVS